MIKQEILLFFVGGVFVIEAMSVILQVGSFKLRGKRIFRMAPLHHHFELMGWSESKVIVGFWILALIFALFALDNAEVEVTVGEMELKNKRVSGGSASREPAWRRHFSVRRAALW